MDTTSTRFFFWLETSQKDNKLMSTTFCADNTLVYKTYP